MDDRDISLIAGVGVLVGIIGIIITSNMSLTPEVKIDQIGQESIGKKIKISGFVEKISKSKSGTYFLTVRDCSGLIPVVIFSSLAEKMKDNGIIIEEFSKKFINVEGRVSVYKGELEIIPDSKTSIKECI
ncbi:nucleic acid binding OB-fold tRNA/helicase-type [Methanothermus fervidus DSM 2088]|uniref:Nucleic acid binding OB-fold tRNA/helicase-type n=1 Tax=Methanothermus fervidus (strain ATCC 43054 / DSM 2088 / JCM 10308 / V24 S) TaxID=523846 RepID=E3GYG8_METFV|nr:OB-fold nucleic acid binding domain-containing protein [Methanothermus fervidus]ADP77350.1 nucleic acid binding OB-fold tRNA/helicase-type [Methanothermus fervidus DSM 2088]